MRMIRLHSQWFQEAPTTDKTRRLHCSEKSATFSSKKEETSLNNVMNKNILCSCRNVCNLA